MKDFLKKIVTLDKKISKEFYLSIKQFKYFGIITKFITKIYAVPGVFAVSLLFAQESNKILLLTLLIAEIFIGYFFSEKLLKSWFKVKRPDYSPTQNSYRFPSTHAFCGSIYVFLILLLSPGLFIPVFLWFIFVCLSRVFGGYHIFTDIFGGIFFALLTLIGLFSSGVFSKLYSVISSR